MQTPSRVAVTSEAAGLLRRLRAGHGPLMCHQSGGCCDGSSPMCYPLGEFMTGPSDVLLGYLDVEGGTDGPEGWKRPRQRKVRYRYGCRRLSSSTGATPISPSTWCPGGAGGSPSRRPRAAPSRSALPYRPRRKLPGAASPDPLCPHNSLYLQSPPAYP